MVASFVPRPKPDAPTAPLSIRVDAVLRAKFAYACKGRLSDATKQVSAFMTDFVAEFEKEFGVIELPEKPT